MNELDKKLQEAHQLLLTSPLNWMFEISFRPCHGLFPTQLMSFETTFFLRRKPEIHLIADQDNYLKVNNSTENLNPLDAAIKLFEILEINVSTENNDEAIEEKRDFLSRLATTACHDTLDRTIKDRAISQLRALEEINIYS